MEIDWREAAKGGNKLGLSFLPLIPDAVQFMETLGSKKAGLGAPKDAVKHLVDAFKRERIKSLISHPPGLPLA